MTNTNETTDKETDVTGQKYPPKLHWDIAHCTHKLRWLLIPTYLLGLLYALVVDSPAIALSAGIPLIVTQWVSNEHKAEVKDAR